MELIVDDDVAFVDGVTEAVESYMCTCFIGSSSGGGGGFSWEGGLIGNSIYQSCWALVR